MYGFLTNTDLYAETTVVKYNYYGLLFVQQVFLLLESPLMLTVSEFYIDGYLAFWEKM